MPHRSGIVEAGVGVMAARHDVEAVIIGGGIGGLAAAVALRRAGRDVVVCERAGALDPAGAGRGRARARRAGAGRRHP